MLGGVAALVLTAGLGIGYIAFHGSSTVPKAAGVATPTALPPGTFTLIGGITLPLANIIVSSPGTCRGTDGFDDIAAGADVVVTDQSGTTIATGALEDGHGESSDGGTVCKFGFAVTGVPDDKTFYGVAVSYRGVVQFSAQQAKSNQVALSLK